MSPCGANTPTSRSTFQQKLAGVINDGLEQLVERQLILHDFDVEGYHLPDSVVDDLVQERIREQFSDRVTLMKTLQAQGRRSSLSARACATNTS